MNINLQVIDTFCSNCHKNSIEKNLTITSSNMQIELQNDYSLYIIDFSTSHFTVLIQNGNYVIIRNILYNIETSILIPSKCTHIVTITGNQIA